MISSGSFTAALLTATLSAPASSTRLGVFDGADAAADRERDEQLVGGAACQVDDGVARVGGRGDVEEDDLVGALGVVAGGEFDGIARVAQADEVRRL